MNMQYIHMQKDSLSLTEFGVAGDIATVENNGKVGHNITLPGLRVQFPVYLNS